jgi:hypothetical protein
MAITAQTTEWGPLSEPIHHDVPAGALPYRDNAFLSFWDPQREVFGTLHVSTSPNAEGRRARFSVQSPKGILEVVEPLDPGTFTSESITFDAGASFSVDAPSVTGELTFAPLPGLGDYTGDRAPAAFSLDKAQPLMHYQRAASVSGSLVIAGERFELDGHGFRDRTWGSRDESASVSEYFGCMFVFPDYALSAMRLLGGDGKMATLGFELAPQTVVVQDVSMTRDASGLFAGTTIGLADGRSIEIRATGRAAGFWCPMGVERTGPTLSAYDEFCALRTSDGTDGFGLIEQGILKRVF